jgi:glycosyltransferase involved in cell wall biosynthesis
MVTTYPPTKCGIGKYSSSLVKALERVAPEIEVEVVRLVPDQPRYRASDRSTLEIVADLPLSIRAAARRLNRCDLVIIQHEFGIFGARDGESVVDLIQMLQPPVVAVLHTVPAHPGPGQLRVLSAIAASCHLVALSEVAREGLHRHQIARRKDIGVIRHGAHWGPATTSRTGRHRLITWGLLGPGKGLERAIAALPHLRDLDPMPTYRIVGRTHPNVARIQGFAYRESLETLASELEVDDMVTFVDRYLTENELQGMVHRSGVVVVPYDNNEQISSGVLTEAVAAGRPVVSTRFPYAEEMLRSGAGLVVDHDSVAMADAIRELLTSPGLYEACAEAAYQMAGGLSWQGVAEQYARFIEETIRPQRAAGSLKA